MAIFHGKSTISMAIFNSYVSLPEGTSQGQHSIGSKDHRARRDPSVRAVWPSEVRSGATRTSGHHRSKIRGVPPKSHQSATKRWEPTLW